MPAELEELDSEPREMRVVRLRETIDFRRRNRRAEHAPQVIQHDCAPKRNLTTRS